jgi:hypothetical protein
VRRHILRNPGSVPTVISDLHHAVLDAHGKLRDRLVRRGIGHRAGADGKACAVAHALDLVAHHAAAGEFAAVVRTDVLDGVMGAVKIENRNVRAVGVHDPVAAGRYLAHFRYVDPVGHVLS